MKRSTEMTRFLAIIAISTVFAQAQAEDEVYYAALSKHVSGLTHSHDIVTKYTHPGAYLSSLKVKDTSVILEGKARYQLARNLLDVHYLCLALSHQGYNFDPKNFPVLKLAAINFKGFDAKCKGEGGYWSHMWADFFESDQISWASDSTYENQTKVEQGAPDQPLTR